jgi:hypothetical protein
MKNVCVALLAFAAACAETGTAPADGTLQVLKGGPAYLEEGDQSAPEGVPPEYQIPTKLYSVEADAGFTEGLAYAQAIVRYFGTNAIARATVKTNVGSDVGESARSDLIPASRELMATISYNMGTCGGTITGDAYGKVWNEFPIWGSISKWGEQSATGQAFANCPNSPRSGRGNGGGGGGDVTCYTLEIDHYWYYPATKTFEYRNTETYTWCDNEYLI